MNSFDVSQSVALVTGANRGIGRAFVEELLNQNATKVYATARNLGDLNAVVALDPQRVVPLQLDVTDQSRIKQAAETAGDVNLLINNAGYAAYTALVTAPDLSTLEREMQVNFYGLLYMVRAFAPRLKNNGGGAIVNVSSIGGLIGIPMVGTYCATKAAVHSLTQSIRGELSVQQTRVFGVYPGPIDTDMAAGMDLEKESPDAVAKAVFADMSRGAEDIYPDPVARQTAEGLAQDAKSVEREWGKMLPQVA